MRRVECQACRVKVEKVPWGDGKSPVTTTLAWFIAHWAKHLSWTETARQFGLSWARVFLCVEKAVEWGRAHMTLDGVRAIGIDEVARGIGFVCSDMWKPYLNIIKECAPNALNILDRFHVMVHFSKAIDEVRAGEARSLAKSGKGEVLKHSRWALLKRPENLTDRQGVKLKELLGAILRSVKAYLLKEQFQQLWTYSSAGWASRFLRGWTFVAMRSKIEPIKRVARMIRKHEPLILNWFRAKGEISNGAVEGMNGRGRVVTKRAYGFRTFRAFEVALYHDLGRLPEPKFTHRFW
jgi:transposase